MVFDSKFYIIAASIVLLITILIAIGIFVLGRADPESKVGKNLLKFMIATTLIGIMGSGFLGYQAWQLMEQKPRDELGDDRLVDRDFNYENYIINHKDDLEVELEYGEEFIPKYDDTLLTLITTDFVFEGLVGENRIPLVFEDNKEQTHTLEYKVNVVDKDVPKLIGVQDTHLDYGRLLSPETLGITAEDPIDGKLEVQLRGDVNTSQPGSYEVEAIAIDRNGNEVKEKFFVIVGGKNENEIFATIQGKNDPTTEGQPGTPSQPGTPPTVQPDESTGDAELTEVAKKVIAGEYGAGVKKQYYLAKDGYNYLDVEKEVNRLLASGYKAPDKLVVDGEENTTPPVVTPPTEKPPTDNEVIEKPTTDKETTLLSTEEVARKVIRGDYGNGAFRKAKLTEEGYNYKEVQAKVNSILC